MWEWETCFIEVDSEEIKVLLVCEITEVHTQCYGGGGTSLFVTASIARKKQDWHTLQGAKSSEGAFAGGGNACGRWIHTLHVYLS